MKHQPIRLFKVEGKIGDDKDIPRLKDEYYRLLLQQMRDLGYVHVLDMGEAFSLDYDSNYDVYAFVYSLYGAYYGKEAQKIDAVYEGRELYSKAGKVSP